jgi:hypothetical protein
VFHAIIHTLSPDDSRSHGTSKKKQTMMTADFCGQIAARKQ